MFVAESNIFGTNHIKLKIINVDGGVYDIDAAPECTIEKLKLMALCHFNDPLESAKLVSKFRLILVYNCTTLRNENSVLQEGLRNNDEILLVNCYQPQPKESIEQFVKRPSDDNIRTTTAEVEEKNTERLSFVSTSVAEVQVDIRKILISLIEASARIIPPGPYIDEILKFIKEKISDPPHEHLDSTALSQLVEMGFSKELASSALQATRMNPVEALNWLLKHQSQSTDERSGETQPQPGASSAASFLDEACKNEDTPGPVKVNSECSQDIKSSVALFLEHYRAQRRKQFKPNLIVLRNLLAMGFEREDIVQALRVTGNSESAACEWLLGERRPSLEEIDNGIDPNGPVYNALMSNPVIRLSLVNPKMLLAYLNILVSPNSVSLWGNDPDVSPVLAQIFRLYHSERHAYRMNTFYQKRQQQHLS